MTTLGTPRPLVGTREAVQRKLRLLDDAGLVAAVSPPEPHHHGCRVWVWMHQPVSSTPAAPRLAPNARPAWTPRDLTPGQRQAAVYAAWGGGVLALLAGVVWLIAHVVSGVWSAATGNPFMAWLVVVAAVVSVFKLAKWRLTRERPASSGGGHGRGCPGLTQHCHGCRDH